MHQSEPSDRPHRTGQTSSDGDHDELLAMYLDRLNDGETIDPDEILSKHPNCGEVLLRDLDAFIGMPSEAPDPPLGTLGDYTLRRQIGRGGMGVVYEAWQGSVERSVALKVLPAGIAADNNAFMRFMREAKTAAQLSHPNVVHVHGMGVEENTPYYAMEYVEGETLAQVLGRLKEAEEGAETVFGDKDRAGYFEKIAKAFADVADGLQHAHSKGVTHRDIKPSNLILDGEGRLRILDFGLARLEGQESLTLSGDFVGTPAYMSPEQARRRKIPVDHRTDIYSLGATLYELLTGQQPFRGKDHNDTLSQIIEGDPRPPRQLNPRLPQDLETIVLKCLRRDARERYGTAEALGQDLRRFVRGDAIEASPEKRWQRMMRRVRRWRERLVVALLALLLAVAVCWLELARQEEESERVRAEHERNLAAYKPAVREAVLKLFADRMSLEAAGGESRRLAGFGAINLITGADFRTLVDVAGSHRVEAAAAELEALTASVPEKPDAPFHLARAYVLLERKEFARAALDKALKRAPDFVPARLLELELSEKKHAEKRTAREEIRSQYADVDSWEKWWLAAKQMERQKKWSEAASAYTALRGRGVVETEPYIGFAIDTYMAQGVALLEANEYKLAQAAFVRASALSPGSLEPELFLAKAYHFDHEPELAATIFERLHAGSTPQQRGETALWITAAYNSVKNYERALHWSQRIEDGQIQARLETFFLLRLGQTAEAIQIGRKATAGDSRDPIAHFVLGLALLEHLMSRPGWKRAEEFDDIIAALRRANELKEKFPVCRQLVEAVERERSQLMEGKRIFHVAAVVVGAFSAGEARAQQGFFDAAQEVSELNTPDVGEMPGPASKDGLELFFARGVLFAEDIWVARRDEPGDLFESTKVEELNSEFAELPGSLSADDLTLYFFSNRPEVGAGGANLYVARRPAIGEPFGAPVPLEELNSDLDEIFPSVTNDGLELYFVRAKLNAGDNFDLWVATRESPEGVFAEPMRLSSNINTADFESMGSIASDGLAIFFTKSTVAGIDIWAATRERRYDDLGNRVPFQPAVKLGRPVSGGFDDFAAQLSRSWPSPGAEIYFARRMQSGNENNNIYKATWHLDCNGNGVDDIDDIDAGTSPDIDGDNVPDECALRFRRGDCNDDGEVDITDGVVMLGFAFLGDATPLCLSACDFNGSGALDITAGVYVFNYLFSGGPAPPVPFPGCGPAVSGDEALGCMTGQNNCR